MKEQSDVEVPSPFSSSYSPISYSFLTSHDIEKYVQLIRMYFSLGELELARSSIELLCGINKEKALELLSEYIYQQHSLPEQRSRELKLQFIWFCTIEYCAILKKQRGDEENNLIFEQRKIVEFELFLYESYCHYFEKLENSNYTEILRYFQNLTYNPQLISPLSNKALSELESILTLIPQNGHIIFKCLCNSKLSNFGLGEQKFKEIRSIFEQNKLKLYHIYITIMDSLVDKRQFSQMLIYTQYLDILEFEDEKSQQQIPSTSVEYLKSLFLRIISTINTEGKSTTNSLKIQIYQSLLSCGNHHALRLFCELEDLDKAKHVQPLEMLMNPFNPSLKIISLPRPIDLYKRKLISQKQLVGEYFHYIRYTKNHIFEFTLEQCLELIKCKQNEDVGLFLEIFPKLKPLFLLLLPTYFQNNPALILEFFETYGASIAEDFQNRVIVDENLYNQFNYYSFLLQMNAWLKNQFPFLKNNVNLLDEIANNSIIHLIAHRPLSNMYNQLLMFLMDDPNDSLKTKDLKSFNRTTVVVHSIFSTIIKWFPLPSNNNAKSKQKLNIKADVSLIEQLIDYISEEYLRLSIIDEIFQFIFLKAPCQKKSADIEEESNLNNEIYLATPEIVETIILITRNYINTLTKEKEDNNDNIKQEDSQNEVNNAENSINELFKLKRNKLEKALTETEFRFDVIKNYPTTFSTIANFQDDNQNNNVKSFILTLFESPQSLILRCMDHSDFNRCSEAKRLFSIEEQFYQTLVSAEQLNSLMLIATNRRVPEKKEKKTNEEEEDDEILIMSEDERVQAHVLNLFRNISSISECLILCYEVMFSAIHPQYYRIFLSIIPQLLRKIMEDQSNKDNQLNLKTFQVFKDLFVKCKLLDEFFDESPISSCWDSMMIFFSIDPESEEVNNSNLQETVLSRYSTSKVRELLHTSLINSRKKNIIILDSKQSASNNKEIEQLKTLKNFFTTKDIVPQSSDYLFLFTYYLIQIGDIVLKEDKEDKEEEEEEDEEELSLNSYLDLLRQSPDDIVSSIVCSNDSSINKVEKLSLILQRDVIDSMINSIIARRKNISNQMNIKPNEVKNMSKKDTNMMYDLNKDSLQLFYQKSPILSVLIALLLHPIDNFTIVYNQYSLLTAKNLCDPLSHKVLLNMIKYRAALYQLFVKDYLKKEYSVEENLTYENHSNLTQFRELLLNLSSEKIDVPKFIQNLTNQLEKNDDIEKAINVLDNYTEDGPTDSMLERFIIKKSSMIKSDLNSIDEMFQLILRFKDINLSKNAVFTYFNNWNIKYCLNLLNFLTKRLNGDEANAIHKIKREMELYKEIIDSYQSERIDKNISWQTIASQCRASPVDYVRNILFKDKKFDIARKVISFQLLEEVLGFELHYTEIVSYFFDNDNDDNDTVNINTISNTSEKFNYKIREKLLSIINLDGGILLIEKLIEKIINEKISLQNMNLLSFIIQFLTRTIIINDNPNKNSLLQLFTMEKLLELETSIKIINELNEEIKLQFLPYLKYPTIIIENLIMNQKTQELEKIIRIIPQLQKNENFQFYIQKAALQIPFAKYIIPTSIITSNTSSLYDNENDVIENQIIDQKIEIFVKGEDVVNDSLIRNGFNFKSPTISFVQSLLSFCKDKRKAFDDFIQIINQLSLSSSQVDINLSYLMNVLIQFANIAKRILIQHNIIECETNNFNDRQDHPIEQDENADMYIDSDDERENEKEIPKPKSEQQKGNLLLQKVENLLVRYQTYQKLLSISSIPRISIADLDDQSIVTMVRDKLIENEHTRLALEISVRFKLSKNPPLVHLGLHLLSNGIYGKGKEILTKVLVDRNEVSQSEQELIDYQDNIVNSIVNTLEFQTTSETSLLREQLAQFEANQIQERNPLSFEPNLNSSSSYDFANTNKKMIDQSSKLYSLKYLQCLFYLTHFASPKMVVQFYTKNNEVEEAINFVVTQKLPKGLFVEIVMLLLRKENGYTLLKSIILKFGNLLFQY